MSPSLLLLSNLRKPQLAQAAVWTVRPSLLPAWEGVAQLHRVALGLTQLEVLRSVRQVHCQQHAHARAAQTSARAEHAHMECVELIQITVVVLSTVVLAS